MSTRTRDPKPTTPPTWQDYWRTVGNETYLIAGELIELSPDVRRHFESYVRWSDSPCWVDDPDNPGLSIDDPEGWVWRDVDLDWKSAAASADEWPCSTTQRYLLDLVLSLIQPDETWGSELRQDEEGCYDVLVTKGTRTFDMRNLGRMGSWAPAVARIMHGFIMGR